MTCMIFVSVIVPEYNPCAGTIAFKDKKDNLWTTILTADLSHKGKYFTIKKFLREMKIIALCLK